VLHKFTSQAESIWP